LYRFCREAQFDVVICNRFKPVNMMLWLNKLLRIPHCIAISHGFGDYQRMYRRLAARLLTDHRWSFVGVSPAVKEHLIGAGCGAHPGNTFAIMNAIDVGAAESLQYSREEARANLALPHQIRVIGTIGRLVPVKGHVHLVRAFGAVAHRYPDLHLAIIGEGRQRAILEKQIAELGLEQRIHLLGARPFALRYIKAFDIFVMPSIQEGLGLALLEAMSGRLPVIGSDVPAMRPLLLGAGGRLVKVRDEDDLAAALAEYCSLTDGQLAQLGDQTYCYLVAHHSIEDYRRSYRELIESKLPMEHTA
jgi:glycosyltransferase involved in cell wall biosynthesis